MAIDAQYLSKIDNEIGKYENSLTETHHTDGLFRYSLSNGNLINLFGADLLTLYQVKAFLNEYGDNSKPEIFPVAIKKNPKGKDELHWINSKITSWQKDVEIAINIIEANKKLPELRKLKDEAYKIAEQTVKEEYDKALQVTQEAALLKKLADNYGIK